MASETSDSADDRLQISTSKKSTGKVPRKIHKAAREKLKRDHMNELFFDLAKTLDVDHQNNGKASMLKDTIRLIGDLVTQTDSLKKENSTLLSEFNYITTEKNELVDETSALDAQVKGLQAEIDERASCSNTQASQHQSTSTTQLPEDHVAIPLIGHAPETAPVVGPVFVVPLHHESLGFPNPFPDMNVPKVPSGVSRPRPRYPSPSDSWSSHILTK